jgi:hypothetical protein
MVMIYHLFGPAGIFSHFLTSPDNPKDRMEFSGWQKNLTVFPEILSSSYGDGTCDSTFFHIHFAKNTCHPG